MKSLVTSALIAAAMSLTATSATAVTKQKDGYRCLDKRNHEVKGATTAATCKSPFRWTKATTVATPAAPKKPKHVVATKRHKHHVSSYQAPAPAQTPAPAEKLH